MRTHIASSRFVQDQHRRALCRYYVPSSEQLVPPREALSQAVDCPDCLAVHTEAVLRGGYFANCDTCRGRGMVARLTDATVNCHSCDGSGLRFWYIQPKT